MKLLHHTIRSFLWVTLAILTVAGISLYLVLRTRVTTETYEQLDMQAEMIARELRKGNTVAYPLVGIEKLTEGQSHKSIKSDTIILDLVTLEKEDYECLSTVKKVNNQYYRITVMTTFIGWSKYYSTIFYLLLATAFLFGISTVLMNLIISRKIWRPFFLNLQALRKYSLSTPEKADFYASNITEFTEMQQTLEDLTERSKREYLSLREFTENASHEIQTPLGIIQSKLDRMSQLNVDEEMARYIVQAKAGVERLRKMNKSLLLLAKLDNNAYASKTEVPLHELIQEHLEQMEDLFAGKNIAITLQSEPAIVSSNRYLADVCISNLFANALHYTPESGVFTITLHPHVLILCNSGTPLSFPAIQLFDRFKKGEQHMLTNGLGLSIVQQICLLNHWNIQYSYLHGKHEFRILFAPQH